MKSNKIFQLLSEIADFSDSHKSMKQLNCSLVAAIVQKGNIMALGKARKKTHPLQKKHQTNMGRDFLHAEIDAIQRAIRLGVDLQKTEIFVLRRKHFIIDKKCLLGYGLAKPCGAMFTPTTGCTNAIETFGIKQAYYTIDSLELEWESLFQ